MSGEGDEVRVGLSIGGERESKSERETKEERETERERERERENKVAVYKFHMIGDGDKVLIGLSVGGERERQRAGKRESVCRCGARVSYYWRG